MGRFSRLDDHSLVLTTQRKGEIPRLICPSPFLPFFSLPSKLVQVFRSRVSHSQMYQTFSNVSSRKERRVKRKDKKEIRSLVSFFYFCVPHPLVSKLYGLEVDNCYNSIRYNRTILNSLFTEGQERYEMWTRSKKTGWRRKERERFSSQLLHLFNGTIFLSNKTRDD